MKNVPACCVTPVDIHIRVLWTDVPVAEGAGAFE